jgi:protease IV
LHSRLSDLPFLHAAAIAGLNALGFSGLARQLGDWNTIAAIDGFNLDGLLALWHPAGAN